MDGIGDYVLQKLDAIRETQIEQAHHLRRMAEAITAIRDTASAPVSWLTSLKPIVVTASPWVGGIMALIWVAMGGDAATALDFLKAMLAG